MTWERSTLGQVAEINPKLDRTSLQEVKKVSFIPMASVSDTEYRIITEEERDVQEVNKGFTYFQRNDILLAKITPCFENGKLAIACIENEHGFGSTEFHVIRPDPAKLDKRYAYYLMRSPQFLLSGTKQMTGSAGQKRVPKGFVSTYDIPLPPLHIQQLISDTLDKADALRRKDHELLQKYDELAQSIFYDMFGDPVRNEKGWEVKKLRELIYPNEKISYGIVQPGDHVPDGIPIVRVSDFKNLTIDPSNLKRVSRDIDGQYSRTRLQGDELLIACVGSIGKIALVDSNLLGSNIVRATARIRVDKSLVNRVYLAFYLSTPYIQSYFLSETRTVSQPTLNIQHIADTSVQLPPIDLQGKFETLYRNICTAVSRIQLNHSSELFENLLHSSFS